MKALKVKLANNGLPVRNRVNELIRYQQHAYLHALTSKCSGFELLSDLPLQCPICNKFRPIADFSDDHAPQRNQESRRFGSSPYVVVLDCRDCNGTPGRTYESLAAELQQGNVATEGSHECSIHGSLPGRFVDRPGYTPMGVTDASDLKTAFLIAFAALGYRWATHHTLDPVRQAIITGKSLDPKFGSVGRFINDRAPKEERQVTILFDPQPCVHVIGVDGHGAKLPYFTHADLRTSAAGKSRGHTISWPFLDGAHQLVMQALLNHQLFLLDHPDATTDLIFNELAA